MTQKFYKFKAETLDDALKAMRKRLGNDAVVVRTATVVEGGILGVFGRKLVELTAASPIDAPLPLTLSAGERPPPNGAGDSLRVVSRLMCSTGSYGAQRTLDGRAQRRC